MTSEPAAGLAARKAALGMLSAVLDQGRMLEEGGAPEAGQRSEALGLARLTLRHLGEIDAALVPFLKRPPPGKARQVLRLMAAEILHGGTPPHAAVDSAVRLMRGTKQELAGLANAVGRRLGSAPQRAGDPVSNLPDWLRRALAADWGKAGMRAIAAAHKRGAPHDLTLREDAPPPIEGVQVLPTGSLRLAERPMLSALPGYAEGAWWVQDAAAALPARLIPDARGRCVLDLCAAPGGKTLQLASAGAEVTALDLSEARLERLRENLARTRLEAEIVAEDALDWQPARRFDAILLDAPCSATGTIRRHPDLPWRGTGPDIPALTELQRALLQRAWGWLERGGVMVYCTCSLLKAEGEMQAQSFLAATPDAERMALGPQEMPPEFIDGRGDLRTRPDFWPDLGGLDGFFAARFRKR